jgi:hypothetical protein
VRKQQQDQADTITFPGTAGARFMVSRQLAARDGMKFDLAQLEEM